MLAVYWVVAPPTALIRGSFMLLVQLSPSHSIHMLRHTALRAQQSYPVPPPPLHSRGGSSFPGSAPPSDMVSSKSVVGVKPGVLIRYQVGEFTHACLVECFIAWSHIYPSFTGKVSRLTHFPLEPGCQDYSFLHQVVEDFEHGLHSILPDSINLPDLNASFAEADVILSSASFCTSFYYCLILLDCSLLLASNLINHGARLGHCCCLSHRQVECQILNWFITFPVTQLHLESEPLCHLISVWILPRRGWIRVFLISDWHLCSYSCHLRHRAAYFLHQECSWRYSCHLSRVLIQSDCSLRSAWAAY